MKRSDWTVIAHAGRPFANPIPSERIDAMLARMDLGPDDRVLDVGCGKAEMLIRIVERFGCTGIGVDSNAAPLALGREEAERRLPPGRLTLLEQDAAAGLPVGPFTCAISVGAGWVLGPWREVPAKLAALSAHFVVYGDGFWRGKPSDEYLNAFGAELDEMPDEAEFARTLAAAGLDVVDRADATPEDWDGYELPLAHNVERYVAGHEDERGVAEMRAWVRNLIKCSQELGGRETLGFALTLSRLRAATDARTPGSRT